MMFKTVFARWTSARQNRINREKADCYNFVFERIFKDVLSKSDEDLLRRAKTLAKNRITARQAASWKKSYDQAVKDVAVGAVLAAYDLGRKTNAPNRERLNSIWTLLG